MSSSPDSGNGGISRSRAAVAAYQIWKNPILLRYCRSRLRWKILIPWMLVVLIVVTFAALFSYFVFKNKIGAGHELAVQGTLFPIIIIQGVILMLMGTSAVASGITQEDADGMTDYQRLTPMSPLAKILGYLFGLPIREYLLVGLTLPFTLFAVIEGGVSWVAVGSFYTVFLTSAILYHLTGFVAGTVLKKKQLAARVSSLLVVLLYLVLPLLSSFGYAFFEYLTFKPVATEQLADIPSNPYSVDRTSRWRQEAAQARARASAVEIEVVDGEERVIVPEEGVAGRGGDRPLLRQHGEELAADIDRRIDHVPFFELKLSHIAFTLLIQLSLITTFIVIVYRKWRDPDMHPLGKKFAFLAFCLFEFILIGNALPLILDGYIFNQSGQTRMVQLLGLHDEGGQKWGLGILLVSMFGMLSFAAGFLLVCLIAPSHHEYLRGLRKANKLGWVRVPMDADEAGSFWHTLAFAAVGIAFWCTFARCILSTDRFGGMDISILELAYLAVPFLLFLVCVQCLIELGGKRLLLLFGLFVWIVPPMAGFIIAISTDSLDGLYPVALSPAFSWFYCVVELMFANDPPTEERMVFIDFISRAYYIMLAFYVIVDAVLLSKLREKHRNLRSISSIRTQSALEVREVAAQIN